MKWYDKYDHIGYDLNGEKIMREKSMDAIDKYLHTHDKNELLSFAFRLSVAGRSMTRKKARKSA